MENTEIKEKLESIELLLSTYIESSNDPKKKKAEGEALAKAVESITNTKEELSGLISKEKALIENFKPVSEVKHYTMDIKNPLYWYSGVIIFTCLNIMAMALFINTLQTYKKQSEDYYPNHMKYKYMKLFWGGETSKVMNELDTEYEASSVKHDNEIIKREHDIDVANATAANAKLQREAAAKAEQEAREAAKKIH